MESLWNSTIHAGPGYQSVRIKQMVFQMDTSVGECVCGRWTCRKPKRKRVFENWNRHSTTINFLSPDKELQVLYSIRPCNEGSSGSYKLGPIWYVMLVRRKANINRTVSVLQYCVRWCTVQWYELLWVDHPFIWLGLADCLPNACAYVSLVFMVLYLFNFVVTFITL